MRCYIKNYIKKIDKIIEDKKNIDIILIEEHLLKIKFFQHERLIHLLVTLFFTCFLIGFFGLSFMNPLFIIIVLILLICVLLYVFHYFFLENSVQYMYKQYDELKRLRSDYYKDIN